MLKILLKQKKQLTELGVESLYLFGSRAMNAQGPLSDFDFAVLMDKDGHKRGSSLYYQLYDILSPLCSRDLKNDVIDIVFLRDVGLELKTHVIRYGRLLLDNDPIKRLRFEERTLLEYADYRPILNMFDRAILQSINL